MLEMAEIRCQGVDKHFGSLKALRGVTFEVKERTCIGFLGPNGAGKTTTIKILAGLARPNRGEVEVAGVNVANSPEKVRPYIGYLPQAPAFYNWMSGAEYLEFCAGLFKLSRKETAKRVGELLERVGLTEAAHRRIGGYSGGMKQRLGIAQALINKPQVLFLDEPVSALDPIGRHEVLQLIREMKRETTVFFSTHVLNDADQICDEVIILQQGEVKLQATLEELQERYAAPVFEIDIDQDSSLSLSSLQTQPWYQSHRITGSVLTVVVKDVKTAKSELPRLLVEQGTVFTRYQMQSPNLEQVFLQVVNNQ